MKHSTEIELDRLLAEYQKLPPEKLTEALKCVEQDMADALLEGNEYRAIRLSAFITQARKSKQ